ncbi:hypothetical protein COB57_05500 [Candidatus Peregrinibacteria bacterium]|nr:MAG: hypothetical protein COB57_05500 [Candidatus Peregrinibacteria bacterium]
MIIIRNIIAFILFFLLGGVFIKTAWSFESIHVLLTGFYMAPVEGSNPYPWLLYIKNIMIFFLTIGAMRWLYISQKYYSNFLNALQQMLFNLSSVSFWLFFLLLFSLFAGISSLISVVVHQILIITQFSVQLSLGTQELLVVSVVSGFVFFAVRLLLQKYHSQDLQGEVADCRASYVFYYIVFQTFWVLETYVQFILKIKGVLLNSASWHSAIMVCIFLLSLFVFYYLLSTNKTHRRIF